MRAITSLTVAAALGAGCAGSPAGAVGPTPVVTPRTIVAFGDSLTSGYGLSPSEAYPAMLERTLHAAGLPFNVLNHGVSGDTTADGLRRLRAALETRPSILILALGANDGLRGVPVAQVRANLEAVIEATQAEHVSVLLCGMDAFPLYGWQYTLAFHELFPSLAAKYNVPLVPFMLKGVVGNQSMLLPDMIHPNAAGTAEIARTIWPYLQPLAATVAARR